MSYTYYGDLLGISDYYKLSQQTAYGRLNDFYNTTFFSLSDYCQNRNDVEVLMVSDSLLIWGDDAEGMLVELHKAYIKLIQKGLLLRGAMVNGRLEIDPRLTLSNYQKMLPKNDTLARAVGLEHTQKGARLLIENSLAQILLERQSEWLTHEGYVRDITPRISLNSILRRISPTPDNSTYELLYFWICSESLEHEEIYYKTKKDELREISNMLRRDIAEHYKETISLLNRCQHRQNYTLSKL